MPADLVLLSPTPLLFKHAYWSSAASRWMLAGLWPFNQHACLSFVTQYCMSAGVSATLSAIPAGMVSHYQPCLLVWCLTISSACWCGASL